MSSPIVKVVKLADFLIIQQGERTSSVLREGDGWLSREMGVAKSVWEMGD
jgi:hypothetical protein